MRFYGRHDKLVKEFLRLEVMDFVSETTLVSTIHIDAYVDLYWKEILFILSTYESADYVVIESCNRLGQVTRSIKLTPDKWIAGVDLVLTLPPVLTPREAISHRLDRRY